jgi:cell wall-associated NlpC family hydrolase
MMRRRQINRLRRQQAGGERPRPVVQAGDDAVVFTGTRSAKGICRHCGVYIGKGRAFHERTCSKEART